MTKFRDKRTQWQGGQLSYIWHITQPSDTREDLYCLTLAQTEALIAVIEHWRYLTRWLDDDTETPALSTTVATFVNDTQRRLMMPCGSDNVIILSQFTPSGVYQESTDGGDTYHDAPGRDPRNSVPLPPPFLPPGTEEAECTYADAIVNGFINGWINATGDGEDLATVIEGILSFVGGILGAIGAIVGVVVLAIAATVVAGTVAAWKAAFVTDVWNRLRCNLHDNQQSDGSFTAADVDAIYARIGEEETGLVLISLQQMVAALGWQGLTIQARSGVGSPTADCSCDAGCDLEAWVEWTGLGALGTIISVGDDYVEVQSQSAGAFGAQAAGIEIPGGCCVWNRAMTEGMTSGANYYYSLCDHDPDDTGGNINSAFAISCGTEINMMTVYGGSGVFTVKMYFDGDCE